MSKLRGLVVDGVPVFPTYGEYQGAVDKLCADDALSTQHLGQIFREAAGACASQALSLCGVTDATPDDRRRHLLTRLIRFFVTGMCVCVLRCFGSLLATNANKHGGGGFFFINRNPLSPFGRS